MTGSVKVASEHRSELHPGGLVWVVGLASITKAKLLDIDGDEALVQLEGLLSPSTHSLNRVLLPQCVCGAWVSSETCISAHGPYQACPECGRVR